MIRICAWCGKNQGTKAGAYGVVTHGICHECKEKMREEMKRFDDYPVCRDCGRGEPGANIASGWRALRGMVGNKVRDYWVCPKCNQVREEKAQSKGPSRLDSGRGSTWGT